MRYKASDIGPDGLDLDLPLPAKWLKENLPDVDAQLGPEGLRFRGRLEPSGDDFLLRGDLKGSLGMACARCLESAKVDIELPMAVSFVSKDPGLPTDEPINADDAGGDFTVFDGEHLDVGEELREELLMAVPMSPHCSEDCKGICPVCGSNRNRSTCDCVEQQRQKASPFASLAKLKS